ncbi:hypothetical protein R5W23_004722 [Gemmata sp. JC673]|uniref:Carrier domain-containing protein n=1 Tax=Gemmata algarum TaxID=2975278 RepID=A0ABU5F6L6_9BACT|nr:hypothetical protein [Gemmata algarum]MDY3563223.1 hypothetical protein [Gemmata algarum]
MLPAVMCVIACVVLTVVVSARRARAALERRFPPISDAEFVMRCSPNVDPKIALKVRRMVAAHFAVEYERVHPSTGFVTDLGAD